MLSQRYTTEKRETEREKKDVCMYLETGKPINPAGTNVKPINIKENAN